VFAVFTRELLPRRKRFSSIVRAFETLRIDRVTRIDPGNLPT
jgi:hypothetical protein